MHHQNNYRTAETKRKGNTNNQQSCHTGTTATANSKPIHAPHGAFQQLHSRRQKRTSYKTRPSRRRTRRVWNSDSAETIATPTPKKNEPAVILPPASSQVVREVEPPRCALRPTPKTTTLRLDAPKSCNTCNKPPGDFYGEYSNQYQLSCVNMGEYMAFGVHRGFSLPGTMYYYAPPSPSHTRKTVGATYIQSANSQPYVDSSDVLGRAQGVSE